MDIDISRDASDNCWSEISDSKIITIIENITDNLSGYSFKSSELSIVLSDAKNVHGLNLQYRQKDKPTNILSFPINDNGQTNGPLGDLILAYEVIKQEAEREQKSFKDHLTHLLLHGLLHLLGYDHIHDDDAESMESLEIQTLEKIGIKNPYA